MLSSNSHCTPHLIKKSASIVLSTCFEESQELWNSNAGVWDGRVGRKRGLGTKNQMPMLAKLVKFMQTRAPLGHNLVLYMKTVLQMTVA